MKYLLFVAFFVHTLFGTTDFVMPKEAFKPSVILQGKQLKAKIALAPEIYLYKKSIKLSLKDSGVLLKNITFSPKPVDHAGSLVFTKDVTISADIVKTQKSLNKTTLLLSYQGCSSKGLCYEPQTKQFSLNIANIPVQKNAKKTQNHLRSKENFDNDVIAKTFKDGNIVLILLSFFGFGLLLALTPCVFPMIPILSSIIISQGEGMNAKRGFILSLVYILAMSLTYTLAGVFAGIFGENIQASLQNEWVLTAFSAVFVVLAFSMFGFFEIGLPSSWQSKLSHASSKAESKGGFLGVAVMGFLSALIVGPCMAPPLTGALVYIGQTGDALLGGMALFVLSLGMGMPLLLIGIGAGKFMPKPGGWMSIVSKVFGVIMLMTAIWMLSRILPAAVIMLLWALLFMITSIYLGAFEPLESTKRSWNALFKGFGIVMFVFGITLLIGFISGATNLLNPLEKFTTTSEKKNQDLMFIQVGSLEELQKVFDQNKGRKIMVDFYANWCVSCKELEHNTFTNQAIQKALQPFVLVQVDITKNSKAQKEILRKYNLFGPPAILFFNEDAQEQKKHRIIGYKPPEEFLKYLP